MLLRQPNAEMKPHDWTPFALGHADEPINPQTGLGLRGDGPSRRSLEANRGSRTAVPLVPHSAPIEPAPKRSRDGGIQLWTVSSQGTKVGRRPETVDHGKTFFSIASIAPALALLRPCEDECVGSKCIVPGGDINSMVSRVRVMAACSAFHDSCSPSVTLLFLVALPWYPNVVCSTSTR